MSFILDALRKSDRERQKNAVPNINQIPSAVKRTKTPRWIVYLMGVLAMCALILGWGWIKTLKFYKCSGHKNRIYQGDSISFAFK